VLTCAKVLLDKYLSIANVESEESGETCGEIMRGWLYPMDGAHPLGEPGERAAERAETHLECIRRQPVCAARLGGNWRTPLQNSAREIAPHFCCLAQGVHFRGRLA
jgi:hypothetical protein